MAKQTVDTDKHIFHISDESPGIKRRLTLYDFRFCTDEKVRTFSVNVKVEFLLPKRVEILDEEELPTGRAEMLYDEYEDIDKEIVLGSYTESFYGDDLLMVYFDKEDPRHGMILNPDRRDVKQMGLPMNEDGDDILYPYVTQYEYIYDLFSGYCPPLALIEALVVNWGLWKKLEDVLKGY